MPIIERIIAGDNIHLERKHNDVIIHCSHMPAPVGNLHCGFFALKYTPEENFNLCVTIKNCVFKLNGKYVQMDDHKILTYYGIYNMIFLRMSADPQMCRIEHYVCQTEDELDFRYDEPDVILLYVIRVEGDRLNIERYAAGGLIDTVLTGEGFLYTLKDHSIKTTVTRTFSGDKNEFAVQDDKFYIPSFNPDSQEGINVELPLKKGGVTAICSGDDYYIWQTSGFPSEWSDVYTVNIDPEKVYYISV